jgi:hypothetical protein
MRKAVTFIILLAVSSRIAAQDTPPKKNRDPMDKFIVDINYTSWQKEPAGIKIKPYSNGIDITSYFDLPIGASPFAFAWGIGFSSNNVHSNGAIVYTLDNAGNKFTTFQPISTDYKLNKLSLNYITVPLEFRIRSGKKPTFRLFIGGRAGYMISSYTKYVDDETKMKVYRIKNIDPLLYGATARIGIGRIQFTGFYGLSEIFKKDKGVPGLAPWSVGVNILPLVR